jgi:(R,R)-butanediol dehydrogenase/meso-butanediol dehydrogenase/diacetyl reductase/L-iditol 2-dehydrogenase
LVANFKVGDRVTFDSTIYCGSCPFCKQGLFNLCDNRRVLGVSCSDYHQDGIFAEYALIEERVLFHLPQGLSFEEAAMAEPAGVAAHAISLAAPEIGADFAIDPRDSQLLEKVQSITSCEMFQLVYEAVGASSPINMAISLVRKGGTVVLVGNVTPTIDLPLQSVVTRQIRLQGSCAINGEYPTVLKMMADKKLDVTDLISKVAPLKEGKVWFDKLYNREDNLLKVVLVP